MKRYTLNIDENLPDGADMLADRLGAWRRNSDVEQLIKDAREMAEELLREHKEPTYGDLHDACQTARRILSEVAK